MRTKTIATMLTAFTLLFCMGNNASAAESDFSDGVYSYEGTGYNVTKSGTDELVAKIDTYFYSNNSDVWYCAADAYFYKRNSKGTVLKGTSYGYAVARFEKGSKIAD